VHGAADWHRVLRFHKKCRFNGCNHLAMIALFRDCVNDEPRAIQRTFLTKAGLKIGRANLGPVKGCAIKIDRLNGDNLAVGEGLESTLSGRVLGWQPAWAVGSAGAIASFPIIPGVRRLTVFGENDKSGANERAIEELRVSWGDRSRIVKIKPDEFGDLNDALLALPQASIEERAEVFEATRNRLWPGAKISPLKEGCSVLDALKAIGYQAFGV
jgi:putative DNA primase/helicase